MIRKTALLLAVSLILHMPRVQGQLKPSEVPRFQLRARVVSVGPDHRRSKKSSFRFSVGGDRVATEGEEWSDWLSFGESQIVATLKGYPASYMKTWPLVVRLLVGGVVDPTHVEVELRFGETKSVVKMSGELFGPRLGILIWRDVSGKPHAATMARYNRRYWRRLEQVRVPESIRPKRFPIVDRFIGGDDDRIAWREGIEQLGRVGFSTIMLPPSAKLRNLLVEAGFRRTAWAVYSPPGYAFSFDPAVNDEALRKWANQQAERYRGAGYAPQEMALFAMSDEPGWYYPAVFEQLRENRTALDRFRDYLKSVPLELQDIGAASWQEVFPIGRSQATTIERKRLFYWTTRFFAYDSARHFARTTRALERAFYPGLPVLTNWNFFSGRFYVPGPVANNRDKLSPDAAMGGHDWMEFGRLRGCTMLWTEDWFSDAQAYQWSFYCAKLRCAARKGGVRFGGYVIPRTAGDRKDGILQKVLCVLGSGGKAIKYFVFGPEYNFPGNCYSENAAVMSKMAEAHAMVGAAEELLWPGVPSRAQVAILHPRSAEVWDAGPTDSATPIQDATNNHLNRSTVDYMAEVFDLYLALQHDNIPVDFVEEDDLSVTGLKPYRVLYVTEPDVPEENQRGLIEWVKAGGILVTVSGAATRDRYDEPCRWIDEASGVTEAPRKRLLIQQTRRLPDLGTGQGTQGTFTVVGVRSKMTADRKHVEATFDDGSPAVVNCPVGKGRRIHFAWMPGLAYWKSSGKQRDRLPVGFSASIRNWITWPTRLAQVERLVEVDHALVESPVLISPSGAAVTLLNWTGEPIDQLRLELHLPFRIGSVKSVRQKQSIDFQRTDGTVRLTLPLGAADILLIRP